jgi:hypothetical protein
MRSVFVRLPWLLGLAFTFSIAVVGCGDSPGGGGDVDLGGGGTVDLTDSPDLTVSVDPFDPNNAAKDTDCDGLSDEEEFATVYPGGKKTDPANPDSDGDGIPDGVERGRTTSPNVGCGFVGDGDPSSRTLPTDADSDADGIPDGVEDADKNGTVDTGETDPNQPDSDGDGLADGVEDSNKNGMVDVGETDPRKRDSDGDRINDRIELQVTMTNPLNPDTDGDGCQDGVEDFNQNGVIDSGETNPNVKDCGAMNMPDADMDGIPDAVEDATGTNKNMPDTDGDGLPDGVEDKNKNGRVDIGETNPRRRDTDCDGLIDGPTNGATLGEDQNGNGIVDAGETDPSKADSDGDGVRDGVERGVTTNPDATNCPNFIPDANPGTTTDPTVADSDGDGIADGAEDTNQNGRVDTGELNPNDMNDGTGVVGKVCPANQLRQVIFKEEQEPDLQVGVPATMTDIRTMTVGTSRRGLIGYDDTNKVAFIVYRIPPPGGATTPTADESSLRTAINGVGALSNATTQAFTTWDGFPALQAFYDQAGTVDLKARVNALANTLVGSGAGALMGTAGVNGPFKIQAEYVHRSNTSVVVLLAITPTARYVEPGIFTMEDTAGGSGLAQFGDANAVQCEKFQPGNGKVDFLFVVDNSGSMASKQQALADIGIEMAAALNNSQLDWRIAMVTSEYDRGGNSAQFREFTTNITEFRDWLTQNSTCQNNGGTRRCSGLMSLCANNPDCWVGTGGSGTENGLMALARAINFVTRAGGTPANTVKRSDATLITVFVGDADDQSSGTLAQFNTFFGTLNATITNPNDSNNVYTNRIGKIVMHGIVCPDGATCGETQNNPRKNAGVITSTGGVRGAIDSTASIQTTMRAIVNSAIATAGYQLLKPPIGASVKVAMSAVENGTLCNKDDIPRSRVNGFDVNGLARSIAFFGACRPAAGVTVEAAVSYRYWVDLTNNPDGNDPPCKNDPYFDPNDPDFCRGKLQCNRMTNVCECPPDCGGNAPPGKICNINPAVCDFICTADCGGSCSGYQQCDIASCTCQCVQNATCAPGFKFINTGGQCGCFCDTDALGCGPTYQADPNSCLCVCAPNCNNACTEGGNCNMSTCMCEGVIG